MALAVNNKKYPPMERLSFSSTIQQWVCLRLSESTVSSSNQADKSLQASPPLKETDQVSSATFYLLYIASLLPDDVHTVIGLDLDFVAVRSALEVFSTDLESPTAAVGHSRPEEAKRVFGDRLGTYFQAGGSSLTSRAAETHKC